MFYFSIVSEVFLGLLRCSYLHLKNHTQLLQENILKCTCIYIFSKLHNFVIFGYTGIFGYAYTCIFIQHACAFSFMLEVVLYFLGTINSVHIYYRRLAGQLKMHSFSDDATVLVEKCLVH